jgi:hypothetical protein
MQGHHVPDMGIQSSLHEYGNTGSPVAFAGRGAVGDSSLGGQQGSLWVAVVALIPGHGKARRLSRPVR